MRDEQITNCDSLRSNRSNVVVGVAQDKQLFITNYLVVVDLDAVAIICAERWSQIHGIRPLNTMTVGDVHQTLCKQKGTLLYLDEL